MVRAAMATAAVMLALGISPALGAPADTASDPAAPAAAEAAVLQQVALAETEFDRRQYGQAVEDLAPTVASDDFDTLPETMQYGVLGLYARALFGSGAFADAHEAAIDLTASPDATPADWALRLATARRIGDDDDAALAQDELDEARADADDWYVSIAA